MSEENRTNFNATKFAMAIVTAIKESLRGQADAKFLNVIVAARKDIISFSEKMNDIANQTANDTPVVPDQDWLENRLDELTSQSKRVQTYRSALLALMKAEESWQSPSDDDEIRALRQELKWAIANLSEEERTLLGRTASGT